jgi:dTDP-4-amino-4,6-dideoxygalactose transaminase
MKGTMMCVSFHTTKILGDTQGGAILLDDPVAFNWLKRMRFDGRTEGVPPNKDTFTEIGYHCYLSPDVAARLLHKLSVLPDYNAPLPNDLYPDLSQYEIFK